MTIFISYYILGLIIYVIVVKRLNPTRKLISNFEDVWIPMLCNLIWPIMYIILYLYIKKIKFENRQNHPKRDLLNKLDTLLK